MLFKPVALASTTHMFEYEPTLSENAHIPNLPIRFYFSERLTYIIAVEVSDLMGESFKIFCAGGTAAKHSILERLYPTIGREDNHKVF